MLSGMNYNVQIAKLIIYNAQQSRSLVSCFVTQPKIAEGEREGQIFVTAEIKKTTHSVSKKVYQKFVDSLTSSIKNEYYRLMTYKPGPLELTFESALQQTNQTLGEYLKNKEQEIPEDFLAGVNVVIGIIRNHQIHFSITGALQGYLIRENKISRVLPDHEFPGKRPQDINPSKIFSHLISGHLEADDGILFCTESLLDYFSLEKLKRIIAENTAHKASQKLQELLAEIDNKATIAGLIIKLTLMPEDSRRERAKPLNLRENRRFPHLLTREEKPSVQDSIVKLLDQQQETNRIITQPLSHLKKILPTNWFPRLKQRQRKSQNSRIITTIKSCAEVNRPKIKHFPRHSITNKVLGVLKFVAYPLVVLLNFLQIILQKFNKLTTNRLIKFSPKAASPKKYFLNLPISSKALLIICIILGLLFVQSIFLLNKKGEAEKDVQIYNQLLTNIEERQNSASASLIYGDEEKARTLFRSALELISKLPQDTEKRREKALILTREVSSQLDKLNRIKTIGEPTLLVDTSSLTFFEATKPQEILFRQNELYTYRSDNNALYTINLATGEIRALKNSSTGVNRILQMQKSDDNQLFFYHGASGLAQFDREKNAINSLKLESRDDIEIQDLAIYSDKLYILAPNKNLILKYYKTLGGYAKETTWNKDETNLRDAASFVIDGSIWILKADGSVVNMMKGINEEFKTPTIDPRLALPTKIWTTRDSPNLYILDPPTKRIIILTKQGVLKQQLTGGVFENLRDFAVDEEGGKIYVLDGSKIYSLDI